MFSEIERFAEREVSSAATSRASCGDRAIRGETSALLDHHTHHTLTMHFACTIGDIGPS